MAHLADLSGTKLLALIEAREADDGAATAAAIYAGLGNVRFTEMRELAESGNTIAARVVTTWTATAAARAELDARRAYHGADKPLPKASRIYG